MAVTPRDEAALCASSRAQLCSRECSLFALALEGVGLGARLSPILSRRLAFEGFGDRRDVLGRVPTATAGNVNQPSPREVAQIAGHILRSQIETGFRQRIRQTGVWVAGDSRVRLLGEFLQERVHQIGTERAIET